MGGEHGPRCRERGVAPQRDRAQVRRASVWWREHLVLPYRRPDGGRPRPAHSSLRGGVRDPGGRGYLYGRRRDDRGEGRPDPGRARRSAAQVRQLWSRKGKTHRHTRQRTYGYRVAGRIMRLGVQLNSFDWSGGPEHFGRNLADIGRVAEEVGFDRIGVADHVWQHPIMGGPEADEPECYATLTFIAANTQRVRLTAMVSGVHFRHPAVLVKTVTTLDVLSGGRACFGVGSGHYQEESRGLGIPCPPQKQRFEMLEETLQIALRMWSGERGDERPFEGEYYTLDRPLNLPQSLSRPHPPVMVAGDGEKKTLRLVARYADACSPRPGPQVPGKLAVLRRHCEAEGRDYEDIEKTCAFAFDVGESGEKVEELIGQLRWLSGMGIETVIGFVPGVDRITPLEIIGRDVIPAVADL